MGCEFRLIYSAQSTVIAMGVTVFALGDMILYNRRKRNLFYAEQQTLLQQRLTEAREAAAMGIADEDQILLLNRERAAEEAEAAKKAKKGTWSIMMGIFATDGLKKEDSPAAAGNESVVISEKTGEEVVAVPATIPSEIVSKTVPREEQSMVQGSILKAVEGKRRDGEKELERSGATGGPLDRIAEQTTEPEKSGNRILSWFSR